MVIVLHALNFPFRFIVWIRYCISKPEFACVVNGDPFMPFSSVQQRIHYPHVVVAQLLTNLLLNQASKLSPFYFEHRLKIFRWMFFTLMRSTPNQRMNFAKTEIFFLKHGSRNKKD